MKLQFWVKENSNKRTWKRNCSNTSLQVISRCSSWWALILCQFLPHQWNVICEQNIAFKLLCCIPQLVEEFPTDKFPIHLTTPFNRIAHQAKLDLGRYITYDAVSFCARYINLPEHFFSECNWVNFIVLLATARRVLSYASRWEIGRRKIVESVSHPRNCFSVIKLNAAACVVGNEDD